MARKQTQAAADDRLQTVDSALIDQASEEADKNNHRLIEIDAAFGDGQPYDTRRVVNETRFYLEQSAGAMLEAGKRLVLLKEHEPHGEFTAALEQIGIDPRAARKLMQAAIKYSNPKVTRLTETLNKTKLIELMSEDDEQLEELADGGTIAGKSLDEIDRMPASALRAALRRERERREQEQEVHEKLLSRKDSKINQLHSDLHKKQRLQKRWESSVVDLFTELGEAQAEALEALDHLDQLREAIVQFQEGGEEHRDTSIAILGSSYYDSIWHVVERTADLAANCTTAFASYHEMQLPPLEDWLGQHEAAEE